MFYGIGLYRPAYSYYRSRKRHSSYRGRRKSESSGNDKPRYYPYYGTWITGVVFESRGIR